MQWISNVKSVDSMYKLLEAIKEVKNRFFTGDEESGYEPFCGLVSVADGTIRAIGHLFAASICNGGPGPGFLAPWVYNYIIGGLQEAVSLHPDALCFGSKYSELYQKVYTLYHKIHYLIKIK